MKRFYVGYYVYESRGAVPPLLLTASAIQATINAMPPIGVAGPNALRRLFPSAVRHRPYIEPEKRVIPVEKA